MLSQTASRFSTLLLIITCYLYIQPAFSQENDIASSIANDIAKAINSKDEGILTSKLADDFTIAGQTGHVAQIVLKQLFSQLGDSVLSVARQSALEIENGTELTYLFNYRERGVTSTRIVLDKAGDISELELFPMEVKTASSSMEIAKPAVPTIEIPFEMAGKLILTKATVNGKEKNFLLDSGSPKIILNARYFKEGLKEAKTISSTKGVGGSVSGVNLFAIDTFSWHTLKVANEELLTLDISHLEEELEAEIHGLIGYELFKDYDLLFDYEQKVLTLIEPDKAESFLSQTSANKRFDIPFEQGGHIPILSAVVENDTLSLGLDCGAESNLLSSSIFDALKPQLDDITQDALIGIGSEKNMVQKGSIKNMSIGGVDFKSTRTVFSDISHLNEGYQLQLDGLIGYEILSRQKTLLSYARKMLTFLK
ncbi:MAG: pepsin/retropepsin-like aspartic protease family protein [Calditrichota bacterium]